MTHMPARIARGVIPEKIAAWVNVDPAARAAHAATILKNLTTYPYLISSNNPSENVLDNLVPALTFTPFERKHLKDHWFNVNKGWWQPYQPVEPIVRQGLLEACTRSAASGKPLDCYWVCAADLYEVWVLEGPAQVTALISTPPPDDWTHEALPDPEDIWIVRRYLEATGEQIGGAAGQNTATGVMTVRLLTGPVLGP